MKKIILILLIIVSVCGYFFWYKPKYIQAPQMPQMPTPKVEVLKLQKQKIAPELNLPGRVNPYKISSVRPRVEGIITEIKFDEGKIVKQGQQLYQIDPTVYKAAFDDANMAYKAALAKRNRYKNLLLQDAISKQEFDDVEALLAQASSVMTKAKANLNYTKVLAPISGYIGKSNFTVGTLVTTNQTEVLTTITQLSPIYVDMVQPSQDAVKMGDQNEILVSLALDEIAYKGIGVLKFVEKFVDEGTDSVRLRAIFANENKKLLPGMFVSAKLHLKGFDAILVPQKVTNRTPDGNLTVFVVEGSVAKARQIKAKQTFGDSWIVLEGLQEGEIVIVDNLLKISDGAKIEAILPPENLESSDDKNALQPQNKQPEGNELLQNNAEKIYAGAKEFDDEISDKKESVKLVKPVKSKAKAHIKKMKKAKKMRAKKKNKR